MTVMAENSGFSAPYTRRSVVAAAGGAGLAAVLTACGGSSDNSSSSGSSPSTSATDNGAAPSQSATPGGSTTSSAASGGGTALAKTSDIPVGGGKIFADQKVVVTQPTAGQFKCFSAICTHQGCTVGDVSGGTINCPCHGSKFHVADGSVANGPAVSPLPPKQVSVSGDQITLA
ncbi:Rieske (2Fe-2S) protein [Streptomyces sp. KK5PA1]|uniref:Cytochrome bc1 complex Rieske iron-sulfur subunit n=2 Tax=Actinacidiphila acididurans TaxID=2784346 RepID=A0ABS2U0P8_9ACTN|nr:Rieske (2Fe-2S) protein [Actinacidiphila acididurans]MBM9509169.1 Rieske (2Fe-2S) protein [Actinacidiphila acididurans]